MYNNPTKNQKTKELNPRNALRGYNMITDTSSTPLRVLSFGLIFVLILSGCVDTPPVPPEPNASLKEIPRFANGQQLIDAFRNYSDYQNYGYEKNSLFGAPMAATTAEQDSASPPSNSNVDYSTTNIQVEGVDEADIVKSDGKYFYVIANNHLIVVDAYPIESSKIVSQTFLENIYPQEMFVLNDKLLLFGTKNVQVYAQAEAEQTTRIAAPSGGDAYYPYYRYESRMLARLYDVSDKTNPRIEKDLEFVGNYLNSRLIGSNAYFVVNSYPQYELLRGDVAVQNAQDIVPLMYEDGIKSFVAKPNEIGYLPPMPPESFITLVSFNLNSKEIKKETIVGSAQSIFASTKNIYIAAPFYSDYDYYAPQPLFPAIAPNLGFDYFRQNEKTIVNKFNLNNGEIGFVGQGTVPGHILNQFSMDEFEGNFRIATTIGQIWGTQQQSQNNLYVLDSEMNLVGSLEGLAPGEKIYSTRFMGPRAYMVTFKKVDPLFVIDVSNPTNPRVLGKLKIPGYSDYLHPIDETHLIGLGKDTIDASSELVQGRGLDFAWYQGIKMAIFDVSDVENPIELHKIVIGDRGTESPALHDHKAFLYDKEKDLLVLPVTLSEISESQKVPLGQNQGFPSYGVPVFQGALVYKVTLENGFEERGRVTHVSNEDELNSGYYYDYQSQVMRSMFIEDVLFTLSNKMIRASDLTSLNTLKDFVFPGYEQPVYYGY